jgi:peroxiredoxin
MRNPVSICCSILFCMVLALGAEGQIPFKIMGSGPGLGSGDRLYLVYKVEGKVRVDSAIVADHHFVISGLAPVYTSATLYQNEDPMTIDISHNSIRLFLEPGEITVTTPDSLPHALLGGTPTNIDFKTLNQSLVRQNARFSKLVTFFENRPEKEQQDIDTVAAFRQQRREISEEMEPVRMDFIRTHPASYISIIALADLKRSDASIRTISKGFDLLSPAIKNTMPGVSLGQEIAGQIKADIGEQAMDFSQPDTLNRPVRLSDFKGRYVLVDFWASWCAPCRAENPYVVTAFQKYKDKGFTVLSISMDDASTRNDWLTAIKVDGLTWTHVSDLKGMHANGPAIQYGISLIPSNFLVDPSGKVIGKNLKDKILLRTLERYLPADKK